MSRYARDAAPVLNLPLMLMLAGQDRIVNNVLVRDFVERTASSDKKFFEYPAACHTLEFETDPRRYFADLCEWINSQSAPADIAGRG